MTQTEKRIKCFEFVYKHILLNNTSDESLKELFEKCDFEKEFNDSVEYAIENQEVIFEKIVSHLKTGWTIDRLAVTEKAILMCAVGELAKHDINHKIVINEYVNLAKKYGSTDASYKLVNALLEKIK